MFVYNCSPGTRNECVHVSVNSTIRKASVTLFSKCAVNIRRKVFKVVLPSLSVNTISVPPVNVVKFTTIVVYYSRRTTRNLPGQGSFCEIRALR